MFACWIFKFSEVGNKYWDGCFNLALPLSFVLMFIQDLLIYIQVSGFCWSWVATECTLFTNLEIV